MGKRHDPLDLGERGARLAEQVELDRDDDLALDHQIDIEGQGVERDVDRPLDRVLDRHEAEVDVSGIGRHEHVAECRHGHQGALGEIGLREQSLLGEGADRAEEADPHHGWWAVRTCGLWHERAGYRRG